jgi:hypothetical protein
VFNGTNVGIGTSSPGSKLMVAGSFSKSTSDESTWGVRVQDETAMAAGVGGGLVFTGNYTSGGAKAAFASISGTKVNGTTSNGLGQLNFYTTNSSSVLVQNMVLDSSGNLGLGVTPSAWGTIKALEFSYGSFSADSTVGTEVVGNGYYNGTNWIYRATGAAFRYNQATAGHTWYNAASGTAGNTITWAQELQITAAGFTQPVAYADTVSALGNTGTATTINLQNANVFTATLTGNCTFTLSNPIATGSSSFTLILTNDGTAGRTVAWAGGSFVFPGGAASLSRTTTANAVDVWVFFTPNGGTTWYGNIAMKNMIA